MKKICFFAVLTLLLVSVGPASAFWKDYGQWWGGNDLCRGGVGESMCKPPGLPPELGQDLQCVYYHPTNSCCCQGLVWVPDKPDVTLSVDGNSISLSWNNDPGAKSYHVWWGNSPDFTWDEGRHIQVEENAFTHSNLNYNTEYYYAIEARGTYGWSISGVVGGKTGAAPGPGPGPEPLNWEELDSNPATIKIDANSHMLFKLHNNGEIWCFNELAGGWELLDSNPATVDINADDARLLKLHQNGEIWRYNTQHWGRDKQNGSWELLDSNPDTIAIENLGDWYFQLHKDGSIWRYKKLNGFWELIDNNPATTAIEAAGNELYQLHNTGAIWHYNNDTGGWDSLGNNPATIAIKTTGRALYQRHDTGAIWRYNDAGGWDLLDNDPATIAMVPGTGKKYLYKLNNHGELWRYSSDTGVWDMLDNNPAIIAIDTDGGRLYELHNTGAIYRLVLFP